MDRLHSPADWLHPPADWLHPQKKMDFFAQQKLEQLYLLQILDTNIRMGREKFKWKTIL